MRKSIIYGALFGILLGFTIPSVLAIMRLVLALFFALTIIGFPIAVQHMKLVPMALLPFGHVMRELQ